MVSEEDLEGSLGIVRTAAAGSVEGIFGPASLTWRVDREAAIFLGAGRALLLQLAHPWVAAAIAEHSRTLADPIGRFHQTFSVVFSMVFGSLDQALGAARHLHRRHAKVVGTLPAKVGPFRAGSLYRANDASALRWVHATLIDTALMTYNFVLPRLTDDERDQYWAESRLFARLFGIPLESLPSNWSSFAAYSERMVQSDILTVSPAARNIAGQIFSGAATRLRPPKWYVALTAEMLPARLRADFQLPFGEQEHARARRARARCRRVYPLLPARLRTVGPYQEAQARLEGKIQPDLTTRWLNQLWIGRPSMGNVNVGVASCMERPQ